MSDKTLLKDLVVILGHVLQKDGKDFWGKRNSN